MRLLSSVFLLFILTQQVLGQRPEQLALDFYAKHILKQKMIRIKGYKGKVRPFGGQHQENQYLINSFYDCKIHTKGLNNDSSIVERKDYMRISKHVYAYNFQSIENNKERLVVPKRIKRRTINQVLPKYHLLIFAAVQYEKHFYILIRVGKHDDEFGHNYYIKIDENNTVVDWCEVGWIT